MQMTLRWYGSKYDTVTLKQIRQIPGVTGVISTLYGTTPGEAWEMEDILALKREIEDAGLELAGIESVNIHDAIKVGTPDREQYIDNYITTLERLGQAGIHMVCYNFMPVFDWTRTELARMRPDGSTVLAYTQEAVDALDPEKMFESIAGDTNGTVMPGWEPERMAKLDELFEAYRPVTKEKLWDNLKYFLEAIMPTCRECDIKMAIHMDDPPWDIFGLPRLFTDAAAVDYFLKLVDDPYNCLTLCSGSLNADPKNNVADIVRKHCDRIAFAHIRNVKHFPNGDFSEAAHRDCCGDTGILDILKAYHDAGWEGYIRPDHGRHLWTEGPGTVRPGYGLYDRALGAAYLNGLWEATVRAKGGR